MVTSQQDKFRKAVKYCHNRKNFHSCMSKQLKSKETISSKVKNIVKTKIRAFGIGYVKVG